MPCVLQNVQKKKKKKVKLEKFYIFSILANYLKGNEHRLYSEIFLCYENMTKEMKFLTLEMMSR